MRARPGLRWGYRANALVSDRRGGGLGDVPADRLYRDRRRNEPAIDDGGRPKYPYSVCWHRLGADGLFADGDGRRRELYRRPFAPGQRVRSDLGLRRLCRPGAGVRALCRAPAFERGTTASLPRALMPVMD